jgi:F420H(2)-dependent quinone reductase
MASTQQRPVGRRLQARVMSMVNVPMRLMLGLPFGTPAGGRLMLAFIVGRKSGRMYRQPLSYVRDGDTLLTPGGGAWKYNLSNGAPVRLRIRGRDHLARPEVVRDQQTVDALLSVIAAGNPMAGRFAAIPRDQDGRLDQQRLEQAIRHGFAIVRWHLDGPAAARP